jgi:transcriptional regulator GlxA family with amidase domain
VCNRKKWAGTRPIAPRDNIAQTPSYGVLPIRSLTGFLRRWGVLMTIHRCFTTIAETSSAREIQRCRELVEQAENLALADPDEPIHISALCRTLMISERTLRKAFHRICGLPPCRHLRILRLSHARRALLSADRRLTSVTEIATCFGFVELGRFSVEYRKVFGESPSQTLHLAPQRSPAPSLAL